MQITMGYDDINKRNANMILMKEHTYNAKNMKKTITNNNHLVL